MKTLALTWAVLSLLITAAACSSKPEALDPVREGLNPAQQEGSAFRSNTTPTGTIPTAGIAVVRIQIFPHWGKYDVPQGKESRIDEVTFVNPSGCSLHSPAESAVVSRTETSLKIAAQTLVAGAVRITCGGGETQLLREAALKSFSYAGEFNVSAWAGPQGERGLRVLNVLPFDQYLKGVVPTEVPATYPMQALKSQAVAARTYAYFEISHTRASSPDAGVDLDDTVQSQAYVGTSKSTPETDRSVDETLGQIITYRGKAIKAYFSSDSGGHTEDSLHVWGDLLPYCIAKKEQYPADAYRSDWEKLLSADDVAQALANAHLIPSGTRLDALRILDSERYASGRASLVHADVTGGTSTLSLSAIDVRFALKLRSTLFSVRRNPDGQFDFIGKGYGHGVGMNQSGSKALVDTLNWDYAKILGFYYDGTEICVNGSQGDPNLPICQN